MFVVCGLNHKTAPLFLREKVSLSDTSKAHFYSLLGTIKPIQESLILSTCNRTELYSETTHPESLIKWFVEASHLSEDVLRPYLYLYEGPNALRQALRVASGLDSMMIGEPQILGQMKQAYQSACENGTVKQELHYVFQYLFNASKRIRNQSGIGNNSTSIASAAVQFIGQHFNEYSKLNVFIIGSGETASLVAKYLQKNGVTRFSIASRTDQHAIQLSAHLGGDALSIMDIPQHLKNADIVISATACPLPFITKQWVKEALIERQHKPLFLLDLAVPRDIEPEVSELAGVHLYNIDDLQQLVTKGLDERRNAARRAEQLIDQEIEHYIRSFQAREANDVISDYRAYVHSFTQQELQRARSKLESGHCHYEVLHEFGNRLINKLLHQPSVGLRQAAQEGRLELLTLAHYLFQTESSTPYYEEIT